MMKAIIAGPEQSVTIIAGPVYMYMKCNELYLLLQYLI